MVRKGEPEKDGHQRVKNRERKITPGRKCQWKVARSGAHFGQGKGPGSVGVEVQGYGCLGKTEQRGERGEVLSQPQKVKKKKVESLIKKECLEKKRTNVHRESKSRKKQGNLFWPI